MIITADSNGEPSVKKPRKHEDRFQRRKPERNYSALPTSQQSSAGRASGSTQQLQPRGHGTYEHNPQPLPKNSGHTLSQHRPTGAQGASFAQCRVPSSNIRNDWSQSIEQTQTDKGYPSHTRRRPRHPASQDTATATHS